MKNNFLAGRNAANFREWMKKLVAEVLRLPVKKDKPKKKRRPGNGRL
jgi:hypothetical protein